MYAIVRQGGKQYRIAAGDEIVCERMKGDRGDSVRFDKLLLISDADKTIVIPAELAKYRVDAELVANFVDDKVLVFKYKPKKGYMRLTGHRQQKSRVKILSISAGKAAAKTSEAAKKEAPAKAKPKTAPKLKATARPKSAPKAKEEAKPKAEAAPRAKKAAAKSEPPASKTAKRS